MDSGQPPHKALLFEEAPSRDLKKRAQPTAILKETT